jgi:hypothetical protein
MIKNGGQASMMQMDDGGEVCGFGFDQMVDEEWS